MSLQIIKNGQEEGRRGEGQGELGGGEWGGVGGVYGLGKGGGS